jgi:5-(carboxyamino)imidazole ribonucleotide synthase
MFNWIGDLPDMAAVLGTVDAYWHDYGKQARPGRKVGHATVCGVDADALAERVEQVARLLGREQQAQPVLDVLRD